VTAWLACELQVLQTVHAPLSDAETCRKRHSRPSHVFVVVCPGGIGVINNGAGGEDPVAVTLIAPALALTSFAWLQELRGRRSVIRHDAKVKTRLSIPRASLRSRTSGRNRFSPWCQNRPRGPPSRVSAPTRVMCVLPWRRSDQRQNRLFAENLEFSGIPFQFPRAKLRSLGTLEHS